MQKDAFQRHLRQVI